jgi:hypothetical protein
MRLTAASICSMATGRFCRACIMPERSLALVKGLAHTVRLDDAGQHELGGFEGGEAFTTGRAFTAAAYLVAIGHQAGVDHFRVVGAAERAVHK